MVLNKLNIANQIKPITLDNIIKEFDNLKVIGKDAYKLSPRSKIGNDIVDYFTFQERLETKGKYNTNFYEFIENFEEFKKKKFIQTMITYYKNVKNKKGTKNEFVVLKEIYNICISAINIMKPLNCMEILTKYNSQNVLNFCSGWGGSAVACAALGLNSYIGVEINKHLKEPYHNMTTFLNKYSTTNIKIIIEDALKIDFSLYEYDTVFSSPPYYFIEKYQNNTIYNTKQEMNELFYKPLFINTYKALKPNGYYIINICKEVFENVLQQLLGTPIDVFPLKKSNRQNSHTELVYVWIKPKT
jgi:hypothetical protein